MDVWKKIKKAVSGLFFEHSSGRLSIGRLAFWPVLGIALWKWGHSEEIQLYHFVTVILLLVYNTGTKMLETLKAVKEFASGIGVNAAAAIPVKHVESLGKGDPGEEEEE